MGRGERTAAGLLDTMPLLRTPPVCRESGNSRCKLVDLIIGGLGSARVHCICCGIKALLHQAKS